MQNATKCGLALAIAIIILFAANLMVGSVHIPLADILDILIGKYDGKPSWQFIIMESRLPQAITATLCGASLATCGLLLQTAFKNPLAGPSIFGISGGAGLGVALVILWFGGSVGSVVYSVSGFMAVFLAAFVGAMLVTGIIFLFSTLVRSNVMLLIIGIMIGYLSSSAISLLNFIATEEGVRSYMVWGMGSFGGVSMSHIPLFTSVCMVGLLGAFLLAKPLNALLLGEYYAENLGVNTRRVRNQLLAITGILTAITTAFCGPVAFIGLAVPHLARLILRTDNHRSLLPVTVLTGAAVALLCNIVCYLPGEGGIIPLNAVTPLVGAPVIIYVIARKS